MSSRHSFPARGLMSTRSSPLFQGRFGRMFRGLASATFGSNEKENVQNLTGLASKMTAGFDAPKDLPDEEESGIPSLYTYLGQFIDHDLTFDPNSSLQKQNDPDALTDFRTPAFDLDGVYGRGPDDQPYMFDGHSFLLGDPIGGAGDPPARDLARNVFAGGLQDPDKPKDRRALIGDPRNDENSIISQLQGLFQRFHNRTLADHPGEPFSETQQRVRFHYQYVILHDFLPRVVHGGVLDDLKVNGRFNRRNLQFFHPKNEPFMPVEFSGAAYRFGHSMVRPGYRLNDGVILPIFPVPPDFPEGLTGFRAMNPRFGIDWGRFIDIDIRKGDGTPAEQQRRLQFAYRIDTSLVNPLGGLPAAVAIDPSSLPARNLLRGWRLGLPSGQDVARAMGLKPLGDKEILIGKGVDHPAAGEEPVDIVTAAGKIFADNCPLWTYILAEAMHYKVKVRIPVLEGNTVNSPQLGPVGGRIVAEVFLGLMFGDKQSLLNLDPFWHPDKNPKYALRDLVRYALGR